MPLTLAEAASAASHASHGSLIADFAIVVAAAGAAALIFYKLRLPVIFGYMLAGLLLGPNLFPGSPINDLGTVQEVSELGVIFLLFFLGLEFDLGRLQKILGPALLAVALQTAGTIYLAFAFGPVLGWDTLACLFFGSLLAISSTMVAVRVLRDHGQMRLPHAELTVGVLILEDILAVTLLVVLTGAALNERLEWDSVGLLTFLMAIFVVIVFILGKLFAPRLLNFVERMNNPELMTLFSVGFLMLLALLAFEAKFSVALGAFLAGAILSGARCADTIELSNRSLHDLFNAVFFVSVGMLINPWLILENIGWILLLACLVVVIKAITVFAGLFLAGEPARQSFRASIAKAQIGEFSFIIAELGRRLEVTDQRLTSIAFGVALITIILTPVGSRSAVPIFETVARRIPAPVRLFGELYTRFLESAKTLLGRNVLLKLLRRPLLQITAYFFIINGIIVAASFASRQLRGLMETAYTWNTILIWPLAAILVAPPLIAIIRNISAIVFIVTEALFAGRDSRPIMQGRLSNLVNSLAMGVMLLLVAAIFLAAAAPHLPQGSAMFLFGGLLVAIGLIYWRQMIRLNSRLEYLFMEGFKQEIQDVEKQRRNELMDKIAEDYPWEVDILDVEIEPGTRACGRRLRDLDLRNQTGSTVIALGRGDYQHFDPSPNAPIFPGDHLVLLGQPEDNRKAAQLLQAEVPNADPHGDSGFQFERILVSPGDELDGNTLAGSDLRRRWGLNVVGLQRGKQQITSPTAAQRMEAGDLLLVVAHPENLAIFNNRHENEAAGYQHTCPPFGPGS